MRNHHQETQDALKDIIDSGISIETTIEASKALAMFCIADSISYAAYRLGTTDAAGPMGALNA